MPYNPLTYNAFYFSTVEDEFNWPALERVPDILADLASVDMHAIQTSGNCIRNITCDHLAGVAPDEIADPRPYCELLRQWSTLHPEFAYLPRKFKIAVTGALRDRAVIEAHDIGLRLIENDARQLGFEVLAGGGMGRTPVIGKVLREFLPWRDLLSYLQAVMRVYNLEGRRDNKYKARIKILVNALGIDEFRRRVEAEWLVTRQHVAPLDRREIDELRSHFKPPPLPAAGRHRGLRGEQGGGPRVLPSVRATPSAPQPRTVSAPAGAPSLYRTDGFEVLYPKTRADRGQTSQERSPMTVTSRYRHRAVPCIDARIAAEQNGREKGADNRKSRELVGHGDSRLFLPPEVPRRDPLTGAPACVLPQVPGSMHGRGSGRRQPHPRRSERHRQGRHTDTPSRNFSRVSTLRCSRFGLSLRSNASHRQLSIAVPAARTPIVAAAQSRALLRPRKPLVVPADTPNRRPDVTIGEGVSPGTVFLLQVRPVRSRLSDASAPVRPRRRRSTSISGVSVPPVTMSTPRATRVAASVRALSRTAWAYCATPASSAGHATAGAKTDHALPL